MILIPIISGALYLVGGQWWKPARWIMGIPIGVIGAFHIFSTTHHIHYWMILALPSYWVATSAFPYGDNSWLNIFGEWGKWAICGLALGLASIVVLNPILAILQGIVGAIGFVVLHWLDEKNIVKNPFQEILRGVIGTIVFII